VLWAEGQFALAKDLMRTALDEGVYPDPFSDTPAAAAIDLHSMSAGAAQATLAIWATHLRERYYSGEVTAAPPPLRFHVITGWGKHSRRHGVSEVKSAIVDALTAATSPFKAHRHNVGMLVAEEEEVRAWLAAADERLLHSTGGNSETAAARAALARQRRDSDAAAAAARRNKAFGSATITWK
jgi:hypothetical protein